MTKQKNPTRRGVSKAEWLEMGLQVLSQGGVGDVVIEKLAKSLGIAKAGFYWHFKDRDDLLKQLLNHWTHEVTQVVSTNPEVLSLKPKDGLARTAKMILDYDLTRYEIAIRQWGLQDPMAARAARRVNKIRLDFIRDAFRELGFKDDDLEMRAMLFACYHTWESPMFREISKKKRRGLIAKRIDLLTGK